MVALLQNYTHDFKGVGGCDSRCLIRVYKGVGRDLGMTVVIATQLVEDQGTSITDWAEHLATEIARKHSISPNRLIWIEHYPEGRGPHGVEGEEHYRRAAFEADGRELREPEFHGLDKTDVEAMIGVTL